MGKSIGKEHGNLEHVRKSKSIKARSWSRIWAQEHGSKSMGAFLMFFFVFFTLTIAEGFPELTIEVVYFSSSVIIGFAGLRPFGYLLKTGEEVMFGERSIV